MASSVPFLRLLARAGGRDPDPVYLPLVVRGVEKPLTVYRPSLCHDAWTVVYDPGFRGPSRSVWCVPGTYAEDDGG